MLTDRSIPLYRTAQSLPLVPPLPYTEPLDVESDLEEEPSLSSGSWMPSGLPFLMITSMNSS